MSSNLGVVIFDLQFRILDVPVAGSTAIAGELEWQQLAVPLVDAQFQP
jgi:hypothetical protein